MASVSTTASPPSYAAVAPQHFPTTSSLVFLSSRSLPTGTCSLMCACKSFWSASTTTPLACACGHHACYHSPTPPPSYPLPATPTPQGSSPTVPTPPSASASPQPNINYTGIFSDLDRRLRAMESFATESASSSSSTSRKIMSRLDALETRLKELVERVQEWEDFGIELEDQLVDWENDMCRRLHMIEFAVAAMGSSHCAVRSGAEIKVPVSAKAMAPTVGSTDEVQMGSSSPPVRQQHQQLPTGISGAEREGRGNKRGLEDDMDSESSQGGGQQDGDSASAAKRGRKE